MVNFVKNWKKWTNLEKFGKIVFTAYNEEQKILEKSGKKQ